MLECWNSMLYEFSTTFKTMQFTGKQNGAVIIRFQMHMFITTKMRILVFPSFNQMVSFEYFIFWFTYGET